MIFCVFTLLLYLNYGDACIPRDYGFGSIVCVCNASNCDQLGPISRPPSGIARLFESNKNGARFQQKDVYFNHTVAINSLTHVHITIDRSKQFQEILGFGGAFTDSAGINILSLSPFLQDHILRGYFSDEGLDYTIGRVPIASSDFSTHVYSYDDIAGDSNLTYFNLTEEDFKLKIPLIQKAESLQSKPIKLFASPWSAPGWMKSTGKMGGYGFLEKEYYQTWAEYFAKFLKAYEKNNVTFWGLTIQNEPTAGFLPFYKFQAMGFTWNSEKDFVKNYLVPTLKLNNFGPDRVKLIIMDDQRLFLPWWAYGELEDKEASESIAGIGFHWYWNAISPVWLLDLTHDAYPNKFILATEACSGVGLLDIRKVELGSWSRAEDYAYDIIQDLLHWTTGWVDWNLALDCNGGPNWAENFVDSPILVNSTIDEFYRQPMYYAIAHFSKFISPGSVRIDITIKGIIGSWLIEVAAFQRPDNGIVLIILNRHFFTVPYTIEDPKVGSLTNSIEPHSIQSYIWWPN